MYKKISVIGGDLRQKTVYELLEKEYPNTALYGFEGCNSLPESKIGDIIILPMPLTFDGENINAPFSSEKISIDTVINALNPHCIVFGGKIPNFVINKLDEKSIAYFDYLKREELAIKNAVPTAEGAIELAISETPYTLHSSKCLVLGFGRVAKALAIRLIGLGAKTTVCARKCSDLAIAEGMGAGALYLKDLYDNIGAYDIIFNTIPAQILDKSILKEVHKDSLVIDLASKPGGVDFDAAKDRNLKIIWALSLPGKVAPYTSGKIIKDTIINILNELEV